MDSGKLKIFLDEKVNEYNLPGFIERDPVSIPHLFSKKQDREIAGFFAAILAWGNRSTIINNCKKLLAMMDNAPYDFILHHRDADLKPMLHFVHRTFNATDLLYFIHFLQHHYINNDSLESAFSRFLKPEDIHTGPALIGFYHYFFSTEDFPERTRKHIATPEKNSACKRLNMFLRWMVRKDNGGVDFGIWQDISPAQLICPLDVHTSRVARNMGLLRRKQNDWAAALELTSQLRSFDPADPVKYDFALFGIGVMEKW